MGAQEAGLGLGLKLQGAGQVLPSPAQIPRGPASQGAVPPHASVEGVELQAAGHVGQGPLQIPARLVHQAAGWTLYSLMLLALVGLLAALVWMKPRA